jgi:hypothetical protein
LVRIEVGRHLVLGEGPGSMRIYIIDLEVLYESVISFEKRAAFEAHIVAESPFSVIE